MHLVGHLKHVLLDLQASWLMWILVALSAASVIVIVERALFFRSLKEDIRQLSRDLDRLLRGGRYRDALELMQRSPSPEAAVVVAGLKHADLGPASVEKAMAGATALERMRLERGLTFLGTLGNNAPFVGLLGTVIGVIEAFEALGKPGAGGAPSGIAPENLMAGISEALVATAIGLFVAIPAVAAYNFFQRRIQSTVANTEALTNVLLAHLSADEPVPPEAGQRSETPDAPLPGAE
jgi:biopolymer transport protein ExbB